MFFLESLLAPMTERPSTCGTPTLFAFGIAVVAALGMVGCSPAAKGPVRHAISGAITFGGDPVPVGTIAFEPDAAAGNTGPAGYGDIKNGKYVTQGRFGAVGGPHIVRIEGFDPPDPADPNASPRPLFREYTTKIDLPRESSKQDFDVPKKPAPAKK